MRGHPQITVRRLFQAHDGMLGQTVLGLPRASEPRQIRGCAQWKRNSRTDQAREAEPKRQANSRLVHPEKLILCASRARRNPLRGGSFSERDWSGRTGGEDEERHFFPVGWRRPAGSDARCHPKFRSSSVNRITHHSRPHTKANHRTEGLQRSRKTFREE